MPSRVLERLVGNAELHGIPKVDAGLITDLDIDAEFRESRRATPDNPVLSLPAEVVEVAVEDIVVGDAVGRREPAHMVPDSLTEATRGEVGVRQLELRQPVRQYPNGLIPENDAEEPRAGV